MISAVNFRSNPEVAVLLNRLESIAFLEVGLPTPLVVSFSLQLKGRLVRIVLAWVRFYKMSEMLDE